MNKLGPSLNDLRLIFRLDKSGVLFRKKRTANNAPAGRVKGSRTDKGYRRVGVGSNTLYVHRIVFALKHGYFPEQVDHKNRDRADNRASNLRDSCPLRNQHNRGLHKKNRSGVNGIYFYDNRWKVHLRFNGRRYTGTYKTLKEAKKAVVELTKKWQIKSRSYKQ